jgi:uncharacterized protein YuzE
MRQVAYYDRDAGVVYIGIIPRSRRHGRNRFITAEERSWGLVHRAERSDEVVGIEMWRPKEMLPPDLLEAIPPPTWTRWEAMAQAVRGRWYWVARGPGAAGAAATLVSRPPRPTR